MTAITVRRCHVDAVVAHQAGARLIVRCRELRGSRTLSEIADIAGIRQDELGKIERGETRGMRFETLLRLCVAYGVSPGELLTIERVESRPSVLQDALTAVLDGRVTPSTPTRPRRRVPESDLLMDLHEAQSLVEREVPTKRTRTKSPAPVTHA
jgi:DNA-binding Xre family transcriptional regulator